MTAKILIFARPVRAVMDQDLSRHTGARTYREACDELDAAMEAMEALEQKYLRLVKTDGSDDE